MKLLLSFLPWIIFLALKSYTGEVTALSISIILSILSPERKRLMKRFLISWIVLLSMVAMLILYIIPHFEVSSMLRGIIMTGSFAVMAWISLIINKPFTIQYAKEEVPQDKWTTPGFLKVNQIITAVWATAMTINVLASVWQYRPDIISIITIVIAIGFTRKFPEYYKKNASAN